MSRLYRGESADEWMGITCPGDLRHPYPTDYEPEEYMPYCIACDLVPVMRAGQKCHKCVGIPTEHELQALAGLSDAVAGMTRTI